MALNYSGTTVEHREIDLRNKPQAMLIASPKGTVPVLIDGELVLEESIEIMQWALQRSDPDGWREVDETAARSWIETNDGVFKTLLDQYKYPDRYPTINNDQIFNDAVSLMLEPMEGALESHEFLSGDTQSWVDVAIFPFIRQFSMVDINRFGRLSLPHLKKWLNKYLESEIFNAVMQRYPTWTSSSE